MRTKESRHISRWGLLAAAAIIIALVVGGALFAQSGIQPGFGRGQGRGQGFGHGTGPGGGQGMGPGMGQGPGMERGPQAMLGLEFLMQDEEIGHMMKQIHLIEGINRLGLTINQVEALKDMAEEAQDIVNAEFGDTRDRIHQALEDQLDAAIAGEEINRDEFRTIMEEARGQHDPGAIKDQLEGILDRAITLLSTEQQETLRSGDFGGPEDRPFMDRMQGGPGPEGGPGFGNQDGRRGMGDQDRDRLRQDWENGDRPGMDWFNMLDDETRARVEEQIRDRMGDMQQNVAKMKIMMMLLSPDAVEAMDLWLAGQ